MYKRRTYENVAIYPPPNLPTCQTSLQWNLDETKGLGGLAKYVRYNAVSLYRGSFIYILPLLGAKNIAGSLKSRFHCTSVS